MKLQSKLKIKEVWKNKNWEESHGGMLGRPHPWEGVRGYGTVLHSRFSWNGGRFVGLFWQNTMRRSQTPLCGSS